MSKNKLAMIIVAVFILVPVVVGALSGTYFLPLIASLQTLAQLLIRAFVAQSVIKVKFVQTVKPQVDKIKEELDTAMHDLGTKIGLNESELAEVDQMLEDKDMSIDKILERVDEIMRDVEKRKNDSE